MAYSPLYKQPKKNIAQKVMSCAADALRSPNVQDGLKVVVGIVLSAAAGWCGMPYLAAII